MNSPDAKLVCFHCHYHFQSELPFCPKCGTPKEGAKPELLDVPEPAPLPLGSPPHTISLRTKLYGLVVLGCWVMYVLAVVGKDATGRDRLPLVLMLVAMIHKAVPFLLPVLLFALSFLWAHMVRKERAGEENTGERVMLLSLLAAGGTLLLTALILMGLVVLFFWVLIQMFTQKGAHY